MARASWRTLLPMVLLGLLIIGALGTLGCGAPSVTDQPQVTTNDEELKALQAENKFLKDRVRTLEKRVKELQAEVRKLRSMPPPAAPASPGAEGAAAAGRSATTGKGATEAEKAAAFDKTHPAWAIIQDLVQLGVLRIDPKALKDFKPDGTITRGEFVEWLVRANNALYARRDPSKIINTSPKGRKFKDVAPGSAYYPYIQGMVEAGYFIDFDSKEFHPDALLTRQEMLAIKAARDVPRAFKSSPAAEPFLTKNFTDGSQVAKIYRTPIYMDLSNSRNFYRVYGNPKALEPAKPVTRAESAQCVWMVGGISPAPGR